MKSTGGFQSSAKQVIAAKRNNLRVQTYSLMKQEVEDI